MWAVLVGGWSLSFVNGNVAAITVAGIATGGSAMFCSWCRNGVVTQGADSFTCR